MSAHAERFAPVGGPYVTRVSVALAALGLTGILLTLVRFATGLGPATALNDGYSWGLWKIVNVLVLTAFGSGGYAIALLVYVLNRGRYHGLVRTAIVTSAMGYTTGVIVLAVDIGRPWNFWRLGQPWLWNLHSVLLEIALCISTYMVFLWLEMLPPMLERWREDGPPALRRLAEQVGPWLTRAYPFIVAFAVLLPSMHQSSLGSLMLLAGHKLHPLWQTPLLPLLFLLSCWILGYSCVVLVTLLSAAVWHRPVEDDVLGRLSRVMAVVIAAFVLIRLADVARQGELALLTQGRYAVLFWVETVLLSLGAALAASATAGARGRQFQAAGLIAIGGGLYRLSTGMLAYMPGEGWSYFPSLMEMTIAGGYVAIGVLGYLVIVKMFPVLPAPLAPRSHHS